MNDLIGKGLIYTGGGELALYNLPVTNSNAVIVGTVKKGQSIGTVSTQSDPNDPESIGFDNNGQTYYTDYDPSSMAISEEPLSSNISSDTSFFSNPQNELNPSNGSQYDITITNTPPSLNAIKEGTKNLATKTGSEFLKYAPYIGGGLLFLLLVSIIHQAKKQRYE
ncbi:MAG: hypothetical protein ACRDE2_00145 [Chitinophagaceae bacterium]